MPASQISPLLCSLWSATADRSVAARGVYTTGAHGGRPLIWAFLWDAGSSTCCRSLRCSCWTSQSMPKCTSANPITFSLASQRCPSTPAPSPPPKARPPYPGNPEMSRLSSNLGIPASLRLPPVICLAPAEACHRGPALPSLLCPAPHPTSPLLQNLPQGFQPTLHSTSQLFPKLPFVSIAPAHNTYASTLVGLCGLL